MAQVDISKILERGYVCTDKDMRLAALLEPDLPKAGIGTFESPKGMYHYESFSMHFHMTRDSSGGEVHGPGWVPHQLAKSIVHAHKAEGLLPEDARDGYLRRLSEIVGTWSSERATNFAWAMRRATAEQMVDAMLGELEYKATRAPFPTT